MREKVAKRLNKLSRLKKIKSRDIKRLWTSVSKPDRSIKDIDLQITKLMSED